MGTGTLRRHYGASNAPAPVASTPALIPYAQHQEEMNALEMRLRGASSTKVTLPDGREVAASELVAEVEKYIVERHEQFEASINGIADAHAKELSELKAAHAQEIEGLKADHVKAIDKAKAKAAKVEKKAGESEAKAEASPPTQDADGEKPAS